MGKKALLIITDGIGYNKNCENNAFCNAKKKTYDYLFENVPFSYIKTSGLSVGLPEGQMGNSEVGHMSIGSGRVLYQDLVKISLALKNGSLAKHEVINSLFKKTDTIHIIGLMSDGGVHSHIEHIKGLEKIALSQNKKVFLHMITDGRDVSPTSAKDYVDQLNEIATISGRFYAMDRDNNWDRVKKAYDVIVSGDKKSDLTPKEYIENSYENGITDEFLEPASFGDYCGFKENDGVIFANFRSDRMREIVEAIGDKSFSKFERSVNNLNIITMTEYKKEFDYPIIFKKEIPKNTLAQVISEAGLKQFHTAETEKYAHVTFFFNGGVEKPFKNETRVLIPSPKVETYDLQPQMSAPEVGDSVVGALKEGYDFIVVNFANGDMVGHTGNYDAAIKAIEAVDFELGKIINVAKEENYSVILTSDHGNAEEMKDKNGKVLTNHTTYDVFCFVIDENVKKVKNGGLNNIAPTVLKLMGLDIPKEMDKALI